MNRIERKFKELEKLEKKALIIYITAGYPSLAKTKDLIFELERNGADIIELGIPFSDPLADGPTIQAASAAALKNNVSLRDVISLVRDVRRKTEVPIVFMTYYNPVFHFGIERFVSFAVKAGVDGAIIPDLPPEEAARLIGISRKSGFSAIFLAAPTSTAKRIKLVSRASSGFIYCVSLTGITGARKKLPEDTGGMVENIKRFTNKPVCVGFGVSNSAQAKALSKIADGIIVGSAVINAIRGNLNNKDLVKKVGRFVKTLSDAIRAQ